MIELCKNTQTSHTLKFKQCEVLFKLRLMNKFTSSVCSEAALRFQYFTNFRSMCAKLKTFPMAKFQNSKAIGCKELKRFSIDFRNYCTLEYTGLPSYKKKKSADPVMNMNSFMMQSIDHNSRCCTLWCFCFNNIISIPKLYLGFIWFGRCSRNSPTRSRYLSFPFIHSMMVIIKCIKP